MSKLSELAERVERGEESGFRMYSGFIPCDIEPQTLAHAIMLEIQKEAGGFTVFNNIIDALNGSLDAALALFNEVLPGWHWHLNDGGESMSPGRGIPNASIFKGVGAHGSFRGEGSTPPAALVAAILRAKDKGDE